MVTAHIAGGAIPVNNQIVKNAHSHMMNGEPKMTNKLVNLCRFLECPHSNFCENLITEEQFNVQLQLCKDTLSEYPQNMKKWGKIGCSCLSCTVTACKFHGSTEHIEEPKMRS